MKDYAFDATVELKDCGIYEGAPKPYGMPGSPARKFNTPITPKENFLRICHGEKPLWIPNVSSEFNNIQPSCMPDAQARNHGGFDWFGIEWEFEQKSNAAMVKPGTRRLSDISNWREELVFPDLSDIDWEKNRKEEYGDRLYPDRPTNFCIVNGWMERLADLTSFEDCLCALLEEPEEVNALFERFTDFHIELVKIAHDVYGADLITIHDDMGTQRSPFISPDTFKECLMPHYKRFNKAVHDLGMYTNFHSCGNVGRLIPLFIESGFDFWEGQDNANDKKALLDEFGSKLKQISVYAENPAGTDEEYNERIINNLEKMGSDGTYICWFVNTKPDSKISPFETIYTTGRKMFCGVKKMA